jgi:hypothetical protein
MRGRSPLITLFVRIIMEMTLYVLLQDPKILAKDENEYYIQIYGKSLCDLSRKEYKS